MRNIGYAITAGIGLVAFGIAGTAFAQSAKFAASWDTDPIVVFAESACVDSACDGPMVDHLAELEMATIHVATHKSVLIGVSAQTGIHLITVAKGKSAGGESSALAEGSVAVTVTLENTDGGPDCFVAPGNTITFKSEMRELKVDASATEGEIEVQVSIETDSVSANHFNFLGVECEQGTYAMMANFDLDALADAAGIDSSAEVTVTLGDRMVTLQEVRAVKGSLVEDPS